MEVRRELTPMFSEPIFSVINPEAPWTTPEFIKQCLSVEYRKNGGNWCSVNTYILEQPEFKIVKDAVQKELDALVQEFYKKDLKDVQLYITQSWLNVSGDEDSHPPHNHPNSMLSGTVYISVGKEDRLGFIDPHYNTRVSFTSVPNVSHPINNGDILIFNSQIPHQVFPDKREQKRISIAFNTFVKGTMGSTIGLTKLHIGSPNG